MTRRVSLGAILFLVKSRIRRHFLILFTPRNSSPAVITLLHVPLPAYLTALLKIVRLAPAWPTVQLTVVLRELVPRAAPLPLPIHLTEWLRWRMGTISAQVTWYHYLLPIRRYALPARCSTLRTSRLSVTLEVPVIRVSRPVPPYKFVTPWSNLGRRL